MSLKTFFLLFEVIAHEYVGTQGTLAKEHVSTLARQHLSTQDTWAREQVRRQGTLSRKHVRHSI